MTNTELDTLYNYIQSDTGLKASAATGHDGAVWAALTTPSPDILIPLKLISADYLRTIAASAYFAAEQSGDTAKIQRWLVAVQLASGYQDAVSLDDPLIQGQLALGQADQVISADTLNRYAKRVGSPVEQLLGRTITIDDVSAALYRDRLNGQINTADNS